MENKKLIYQVNVRLSGQEYEKIKRRAAAERRSMGETIRLLLEWILPQVNEAGPLTEFMSGMPGRKYSRKVSQELQDKVHALLDQFFERGSSEIAERICAYLESQVKKLDRP